MLSILWIQHANLSGIVFIAQNCINFVYLLRKMGLNLGTPIYYVHCPLYGFKRIHVTNEWVNCCECFIIIEIEQASRKPNGSAKSHNKNIRETVICIASSHLCR